MLTGGEPLDLGGDLAGGFYITHRVRRPQRRTDLRGGDLRSGALGDVLLRLRRGQSDRQRGTSTASAPVCRDLGQRQAGAPARPRPMDICHFARRARPKRAGGQIDDDTVAYHFHEPLGVVGQIIPWNFPILAVEARPGSPRQLRLKPPSRPRPRSCSPLMDLIGESAARRKIPTSSRLRRRGRKNPRFEQPDRVRSHSPARPRRAA